MIATLTRPYLENHPIGKVWFAVAVVVVVIELTGLFRRRSEATSKDRGSQIVLRVCVTPAGFLLICAPTIAPGADIRPQSVAPIVGLIVFSAGEALRVWSRATLGRYFTYTVQTSGDQPVISTGPYQFVRHPSYTGVLLISLGIGFAWGNWLGLAGLVVMSFIGISYRIHVEEKALYEDLGDRYRIFAEHHNRLIPYIW